MGFNFDFLRVSRRDLLVLAPMCLTEFIGTLLFQLIGSMEDEAFSYSTTLINGIGLMVLVYATAHISGGHLNPAVTLMAFCLGEQKWLASICYMISQFSGAVCGAALTVVLTPGAVAMSGKGPGCFRPNPDITDAQVFGWEFILTGLLGLVVAGTAIAKPGHGNAAPAAIGLTLFVCASVAGGLTGSYLNPARVFAPIAVYRCGESIVGEKRGYNGSLYMASEFMGGLLAAGLFVATYKFLAAMEAKADNRKKQDGIKDENHTDNAQVPKITTVVAESLDV